MRNFKICTVVVGKTLNEFLKNLKEIQKESSMIELRVDLIKDLKKEDLSLIKKRTKKEVIFTWKKNYWINEIFDFNFDYIDLDFKIIRKIKLPQRRKSKLIISYHNFQKTPKIKVLKLIIKKMKLFKPEIIKIASYVNNLDDIKTLVSLMVDKSFSEQRIIIGMGKKGKITRIIGPLLGCYLTYASTSFGQSAPGQIDIKSLKKTYEYFR